MSRMVWTLLAVVLIPVVAGAQALVDRVPADTTIYLGWAGAQEMQDEYEGTHAQGLLQASQLQQFFEQSWPRLVERISKGAPKAASVLPALSGMLEAEWRYPTAVYVRGEWGQEPEVTLLISAGKDAAAIAQRLNASMTGDSSARAVAEDGLLRATTAVGDKPTLATAGQSLGADNRFTASLKQAQVNPALVFYVNTARIRESSQRFVDKIAPPTTQPLTRVNWGLVGARLTPIALAGTDSITWTAGFEGKQWSTAAFVAAPAPRQGMAAVLESKPLSREALQAVPMSADWLVARRLDLAMVYTQLRSALEKAQPQAVRMLDMGMGGFTMALGGDPEDLLLKPLGDEWVVYTAPNVTGVGPLGAVVLNRVDDAAKVNRGLSSLAILATNAISGQLRQSKMSLQLKQHTHNGTKISYVNSPVITPSWAVRDNILYLSLYPQSVAAALDVGGQQAQSSSILDKPEFQQVRKQLPDVNATSISFVDLPQTAEQSYTSLLAAMQLYMGMTDLYGAEGQPLLLPPISAIKPHLTPSGRVAWLDDAGWHAKTIGPFPMHDLFAGELSAISTQYLPLLVGAAPALIQARATARDVQGMANLRQIGMGVMMYSNIRKGQLPPDLGALVTEGFPVAPEVFVRPQEQGLIPPDLDRSDHEAVARWVNASTSYTYLGAGLRMNQVKQPSEFVIAHEERAEEVVGSGKIAVLFLDAHVEKVPALRLEELLERQRKR